MLGNKIGKYLDLSAHMSYEKSLDTINTETLLYFLLEDPDVVRVFFKILGNEAPDFMTFIQKVLMDYIDNEVYNPRTKEPIINIKISESLDKYIKLALSDKHSSPYIKEIDALFLLQVLFSDNLDQPFGISIFEQHGINNENFNSAVKYVRDNPIGDQEIFDSAELNDKNDFYKYCSLLNFKDSNVDIDPIIGRHKELDDVITSLSRRKKNNPILVGQAGVGKTAIAEGLVSKIFQGEVPENISNANVYSLDVGALISGTKFRGDMEERLNLVLNKLLKEFDDGGCPILFIDEIHMIIGAGSGSDKSMDISNLIKPILTKGKIRFFGATTDVEFRKFFEKDHALARRFQKIEVVEPSINDSIKILHGVKQSFEKFHGIEYSDEAIVSAVQLSARYIHDRQLPDKAIDILDIVGAIQQNKPEKLRKLVISSSDIEDQISKMVKIPISRVQEKEKVSLLNLENDLKSTIFGQEEAISAVSDVIKISKAKLRRSKKPIGSFLFVGPTGVGKTELTNQLGKSLDMEIIRLDMSEYQEPHKISSLLGAPPGYVGHGEPGQLTGKVLKNPHCIILLDEIEKAHPKIHDVFLQIMDNGQITDSEGLSIDFTNTLIIMTSNAGASDLSKRSIGFSERELPTSRNELMNQIEKHFSPEFRNRLDSVIQFKQLNKEHITLVVDKFLADLESILHEEHGFSFRVSKNAKDWLAIEGYDFKLGARPMSRLIRHQIEVKAANLILGRDTSKNGLIMKVSLNQLKDGLSVSLTELKSKEPLPS